MSCCCSLLFSVAFYTTSALLFILSLLRFLSSKQPNIKRNECERTYFSFKENKAKEFPDLIQNLKDTSNDEIKPSLYLSVIVPAFNEEQRLPKMLNESIEYLENQKFKYEIIVVDDGSSDRTSSVVNEFAKKLDDDKIKLLKLKCNLGKGGAVRLGVLSAAGELILFADADGAAKFGDFKKLEQCLIESGDSVVAIGSRAHLEQESIAARSLFRTLLMYGFHFIVWFFTVRSVKDTQCGFKLFRRAIAIKLFNSVHVTGWAFDVELIYLMEYLKVNISEIAISWIEIEGSKIVPVFSWIAMGFDVLKISFMYAIGAWQLPSKNL